MKFYITNTLLSVYHFMALFYVHPVLFPLLVTGVAFTGFLVGYSFLIRKERDVFKEENQYFIDTFHKIRSPITLIKTPLEMACHQCDSDKLKNELKIVLRNLAYLDSHLSDLMCLQYLFMGSENGGIVEHELGTFIRQRLCLFLEFAKKRGVELQYEVKFEFQSVWINTSVVLPVVDRFIRYAILGANSGERVVFAVTGNNDFWSIKTQHVENEETLAVFRKYIGMLLQTRVLGTFRNGPLVKRLLNMCNGKLIFTSTNTELRFPHVTPSVGVLSEALYEHLSQVDLNALFGDSDKARKESGKPSVMLVDSDEHFGAYLKNCLSDCYSVKHYTNGQEAYDAILTEYPDLIICDVVLEGMKGEELSSRLKTSKHSAFIPIILLGTSMDLDERDKRKYSLADTYMHKPLHPEDLKVEISVLINNSIFLRKSFLQKIFGESFIEAKQSLAANECDQNFLKQVKAYILSNLEDEELSISSIAAEIRMSRTAFYIRWKSLTGEAPKYFIYRVRMEKARELLESGKYTVAEIPEMVGLKNLKNFRMRYKEYFGRSPKESIRKL